MGTGDGTTTEKGDPGLLFLQLLVMNVRCFVHSQRSLELLKRKQKERKRTSIAGLSRSKIPTEK